MNPKVNFYFKKDKKWQAELQFLREIMISTKLVEELKWGVPCYTFEGSNIVLIHAFKDYVALLFTKGVLLKDPKQVLVQQTKNVQSARQIRFASSKEITALKTTIKAYVKESIDNEKMGVKVPMKKVSDYEIPIEFKHAMDTIAPLHAAFKALTPGRQRAYLLYFAAPKQSKTRVARVEKYTDAILDGIGLDD